MFFRTPAFRSHAKLDQPECIVRSACIATIPTKSVVGCDNAVDIRGTTLRW